MNSVKSLFSQILNLDVNAICVPIDVEQQFVTHPEIVLSCLDYFSALIPYAEQASVDLLIQQVRKKGIMPAPHPSSKIKKLISSSVDGAGVQCILFETKAKNQRTILLLHGYPVENIPLMEQVTARSVAHAVTWQIQ